MTKISVYNNIVFVIGGDKNTDEKIYNKLSNLAIKTEKHLSKVSDRTSLFVLKKPFSSKQHRDAVADVFYDEGFTVGGCWMELGKPEKTINPSYEFLKSVCDIAENNGHGKVCADDLFIDVEIADTNTGEIAVSVYMEDECIAFSESISKTCNFSILHGRGMNVFEAMLDYLSTMANPDKCAEFGMFSEIDEDEFNYNKSPNSDVFGEITDVLRHYYPDRNIGISLTMAKMAFKQDVRYAVSLTDQDGAVGFIIDGKAMVPMASDASISQVISVFARIVSDLSKKGYKIVTGIK